VRGLPVNVQNGQNWSRLFKPKQQLKTKIAAGEDLQIACFSAVLRSSKAMPSP